MKIISLEFKDDSTNWTLEKIHFGQLNLLVGASGVGKTKILNVIKTLQDLAMGNTTRAISWSTIFVTLDEKTYHWSGQTTVYGLIDNEQLSLNNKIILERQQNDIIFQGNQIPKLNNKESIINILNQEEDIKPAFRAFQKIIFSEMPDVPINYLYKKIDDLKKDIESIRNSKVPIIKKLFFTEVIDLKEFKEIETAFIDIFPSVKKIGIAVNTIPPLRNTLEIFLREHDIEHGIPQQDISTGMLKTLLQIAEIYLSPDGSLILIDEFENSLGVNCIDDLTKNMLHAQRNLQFILTSHHPYIINNINHQYWKLVTRNGNRVKAESMDKFNFGKSKHQAFIQLINLEEYQTGMRSL